MVDFDIKVKSNYIDRLPHYDGGLYFFFNDDDELMYIGKAVSLYHRVREHIKGKWSNTYGYSHNFTKIGILVIETEEERDSLETEMINKYKPLLNLAKVTSYTTSRYNRKYMSQELIDHEENFQRRFDAAMKDFCL